MGSRAGAPGAAVRASTPARLSSTPARLSSSSCISAWRAMITGPAPAVPRIGSGNVT